MRSTSRPLPFALLALLLAGCQPDDEAAEPAAEQPVPCDPGVVEVCDCPIGSGINTCQADGLTRDACVCPVQHVVMAPGAELLDSSVRGFTFEDGTLSVPAEGNEALATVDVGTVIASFEGAGFLGRVVRVTPVDGRIVVETTPVALREAFTELDVRVSGPVDLRGQLPEELKSALSPGAKKGVALNFSDASLTFSGPVDATIQILPESGVDLSVWVDLQIKLRPRLDVEALEELRAVVYVDATATLATAISVEGATSVEAEVNIIEALQRALGQPAMGINVPIGGGVSAYADVNFACGLEVGGSVSVETSLTGNLSASGGVDWNDDTNTFEPVSGLTRSFDASLDSVEFEAYSSATCALQPQLGLTFLGVATAFLQAGPEAEARLFVNSAKYGASVEASISGSLGANISVDLLVTELNLLDEQYPLFSVDLGELWETEFAICGDGLHHLDEVCDPGPLYYALEDGDADRCIPPGDPGECTCRPGYKQTNSTGPIDLWGLGANYCVPAGCGDGIVVDGETCDQGGLNGTACGRCDEFCHHVLGERGDGWVDDACGEVCDDGNTENCDACPNAGTVINRGCGDGVLIVGCEECEPLQLNCTLDCRLSRGCGDGVLGSFEQCDDGNTDDCDDCHNNCTLNLRTCGDGRTCANLGEECDVPGGREVYTCDADCTVPECGDGYVNEAAFEECDPGAVPTADCLADCTLSFCGDRIVNPLAGEHCDGGPSGNYTCDVDCTPRVCGDGTVGPGEACDDGDTDNCTAACNAACTGPATPNVCGDYQTRCTNADGVPEVCDSGIWNGRYGGCNADCTGWMPRCGDGTLDGTFGEVCDDSNQVDGDGCRGDCSRVEVCGDSIVDDDEACDDGRIAACSGPCRSDCSGLEPSNCLDSVISDCEVCRDSSDGGLDEGCSLAAPHCSDCARCSADECGDGVVGPSEVCEPQMVCNGQFEAPCTHDDTSACDPGVTCRAAVGPGSCAADCTRLIACGDGIIDYPAEFCEGGPGCDPVTCFPL